MASKISRMHSWIICWPRLACPRTIGPVHCSSSATKRFLSAKHASPFQATQKSKPLVKAKPQYERARQASKKWKKSKRFSRPNCEPGLNDRTMRQGHISVACDGSSCWRTIGRGHRSVLGARQAGRAQRRPALKALLSRKRCQGILNLLRQIGVCKQATLTIETISKRTDTQ